MIILLGMNVLLILLACVVVDGDKKVIWPGNLLKQIYFFFNFFNASEIYRDKTMLILIFFGFIETLKLKAFSDMLAFHAPGTILHHSSVQDVEMTSRNVLCQFNRTQKSWISHLFMKFNLFHINIIKFFG